MLILDRYALDLANERNAPQYRLEEACSALGVKTLKNTLASYRHAARCRRGEGALKSGHTVALAPETAGCGIGTEDGFTAKNLKTKNTKRDRGATSDALCDPAP